jgi:hypothetical protein
VTPTINIAPPSIPDSFVCAPEDLTSVQQLQDSYFENVLRSLGWLEQSHITAMCRIRSREIVKEREHVASPPSSDISSDDRLTELIINDRIVATVLTIRTESNFVQVIFGLHISPEIEQQVRRK